MASTNPIAEANLSSTAQAIRDAKPRTWTWIPVSGSRCGNGTETGFAYSGAENSNSLLIVYEGGGACWDYLTCYVLNSAFNLSTGFNSDSFQKEVAIVDNALFVTNRGDSKNPFKDASLAYIPYCTGDLHDGNNIVQYPGAPSTTYHLGFQNGSLITAALAEALPKTARVTLSGFSAGGFGAVLHYDDTQTIFSDARIDIISDSAETPGGVMSRPSWKSVFPKNCPGCDASDYSTLLPAYAKANPKSRFAAMSYTFDTVLPLFQAMTLPQFQDLTNKYFSALRAAGPNAQTYFALGAGHVVLFNSAVTSGLTPLPDFLTKMVQDDPAWASVQ